MKNRNYCIRPRHRIRKYRNMIGKEVPAIGYDKNACMRLGQERTRATKSLLLAILPLR